MIDPGFRHASRSWSYSTLHGLHLAAILNTHGHADHIAGNEAMKEAFPDAPLIIGRNEAFLLRDPEANLSAPFGAADRQPRRPTAWSTTANGSSSRDSASRCARSPDTAPARWSFVCDEFDPPFVFGGDVLFAGSIGRTDLGGNMPQLLQGIRAKLFPLPDTTVIYPGHGPATTIGEEKRSNPFVGESAALLQSR